MKLAAAALALLVGCYAPKYPVTSQAVEAGTYRLDASNQIEGAQGTAWAVNDHTVVTAGHMCRDFEHYELVSLGNRHIPVTPVLYETSEANGDSDLCILHSFVPLPDPLLIARQMPRVGAAVGYVGYPEGVYSIESGLYVGDLSPKGELKGHYVVEAPSNHGASGSAVYYGGGVFGVLVRLRTDNGYLHDGTDGFDIVPLSELVAVLDAAGVDYYRALRPSYYGK